MNYDIHKAGAIIIKDRKILLLNSKGKKSFVAPGGKLEKGENAKSALIRELKEELSVVVSKDNLEEFLVSYAQATDNEYKRLRMDTFIVNSFEGEVKPDREIERIIWINSNIPTGISIGSIFEYEVIPKLKKMDLID